MKKKVGSFGTQHIQHRVALSEWKHALPGKKKVMIKQIKDKHVWLSLAVRYYFWMGFVDR